MPAAPRLPYAALPYGWRAFERKHEARVLRPRSLRIGSLFSGAGGLDLAVEAVTGGRTVWQVEREPAARRVLARHWRGADQSCTDVRDARGLPPVDVICGGFPCQDLSVAGKRAGLIDGERSGLFFELARVVGEQRPGLVVLENVPGVSKWRDVIEAALPGYGCRWAKWSATTAGAPHLRRRVLVVATLGGPSLPDLDLTVSPKEWAERVADGRPWPTPSVKGNDNRAELSPTSGDGLATAAREACWATPRASDDRGPGRIVGRSPTSEPLSEQARTWPSPAATDAKTAGPGQRRGQLGEAVGAPYRLHAPWVETLMGWPVGWTEPEGPSLRGHAEELLTAPRWPRGRPPAEHVGPWPGYEWEPSRTESGPPTKGRPARLRMCGNGVVPQAAAIALAAALAAG
jgi:site-specific DNA-cytosine methylase